VTQERRAIGTERLSTLFRAQHVAVVGASDKSYFSQIAVENMDRFGQTDRIHLVNPRSPVAHGRATVATLAEIEAPIDLVFTMVPQAGTPAVLTAAAQLGIRNAVVMSSGYAEAGAAGRAAQDELIRVADDLDMVLLGPNMLGFANFVDRVAVTPIPNLPTGCGHVALLSQSGASSSAMLEFANTVGVDLSYLVTLGNEAMVTAGDVLDFLVEDEQTRVIAIFMETIRNPRVFARAARRAFAAGKAVVVLKAGRSELAARTAAAHTGAFVGDEATVDAVLRDLGVIRVDTIEDMLITAGAVAELGRLERPGVGVVSISGGACDIIADLAADIGLELPALDDSTAAALREVMPAYGTVQNPLDVTGAAVIDPTLTTSCLVSIGTDPSIGVVLAVNKLPWQAHEQPFSGQVFVDSIGKGDAGSDVPVVFVNQVMQPITDVTRASMADGGVRYAICGLGHAVTAMGHLAWWSAQSVAAPDRALVDAMDVVVPSPRERRGVWSEFRARELLRAAGVPVVPADLVRTADEAAAAAARIAAPVAIKLVSPQVLHKSDIGGVRLGVNGEKDVRAAFEAVTAAAARVPGAAVEGALVAPMRSGGIELLVGVVRDPQWGPMLAIALGGVFTEVLHDGALAPLPVTSARIRDLVASLRGAAVLDGVRGGPPADLDAVVAAIARIAELAYALGGDLESLEVNPLRVDGSVVEALDAVLTWRDPVAVGITATEQH
jgi:acyl-CoA synthetase (NDP forming)